MNSLRTGVLFCLLPYSQHLIKYLDYNKILINYLWNECFLDQLWQLLTLELIITLFLDHF